MACGVSPEIRGMTNAIQYQLAGAGTDFPQKPQDGALLAEALSLTSFPNNEELAQGPVV